MRHSSMACGSKEGDFFTFYLTMIGLLTPLRDIPWGRLRSSIPFSAASAASLQIADRRRLMEAGARPADSRSDRSAKWRSGFRRVPSEEILQSLRVARMECSELTSSTAKEATERQSGGGRDRNRADTGWRLLS